MALLYSLSPGYNEETFLHSSIPFSVKNKIPSNKILTTTNDDPSERKLQSPLHDYQPPPSRPDGFSDTPPPAASPPISYNSVPPPAATEFELIKQRAQEDAACRTKFDNGAPTPYDSTGITLILRHIIMIFVQVASVFSMIAFVYMRIFLKESVLMRQPLLGKTRVQG